jgi:hypothetical protein
MPAATPTFRDSARPRIGTATSLIEAGAHRIAQTGALVAQDERVPGRAGDWSTAVPSAPLPRTWKPIARRNASRASAVARRSARAGTIPPPTAPPSGSTGRPFRAARTPVPRRTPRHCARSHEVARILHRVQHDDQLALAQSDIRQLITRESRRRRPRPAAHPYRPPERAHAPRHVDRAHRVAQLAASSSTAAAVSSREGVTSATWGTTLEASRSSTRRTPSARKSPLSVRPACRAQRRQPLTSPPGSAWSCPWNAPCS